jgi:putative peptidoglycan lipid II flippase
MSTPRRVQHVPRHLHSGGARTVPAVPVSSMPRPVDTAPERAATSAAGPVEAATAEPDTAGSATPSGPGSSTSTRGGLLRATAVMASGSLVSRILGFVRSFLFGAIFVGFSSSVGSAFSAANQLPNTIWIMIGGGTLNAILVPAIVRAARRPDRGADFTSRLFTLVAVAAGGLTIAAMIAVPALLVVTSGNLPPQTYALAVVLGYWMMPQIFFSAMYLMAGQLLNAHDNFGPYQWAPVFNNLIGIIGAAIFLFIWGSEGDPTQWTLPMVIMLAAMNVGGSVTQVVFLAFHVHKLGLHLRPRWGFRGLGLGKLGRIGLWTMGMLGLAQVGIWAGRWAVGGAVHAAESLQGKDAAAQYAGLFSLDNAYTVFMIPQGIIAVSLVTAAFPSLSRHAAEGEHTRAMRRYAQTNRMLAVPMVLCTVVLMVLGGPVMFVIDGGASPVAARANGVVLAAYMVGLVPFAATYLTKRAFYAYEDAKAPFLMQIPVTLVPLLAVLPIVHFVDPRWVAPAAALASALGNLAGWAFGQWLLSRHARRLGATPPNGAATLGVLARLTVAGLVGLVAGVAAMGLIGDAMWSHRLLTVALGIVVGLVMSAVFVLVAWLLRVEELRSMIGTITARLHR